MKKALLVAVACAFLFGNAVVAEPRCTSVERTDWMGEADFMVKVYGMGYDLETFEVTDGNCYALTKINWSDEVEYFNPVTGDKYFE